MAAVKSPAVAVAGHVVRNPAHAIVRTTEGQRISGVGAGVPRHQEQRRDEPRSWRSAGRVPAPHPKCPAPGKLTRWNLEVAMRAGSFFLSLLRRKRPGAWLLQVPEIRIG
jgi:hypothetical protein